MDRLRIPRNAAFVLALALALLAPGLVQAQPGAPALLSYQGQLTNASGVPITSPTAIRFTLLWGGTANENPSTGKPVYQEDATVSPDSRGTFLHLIGAGVPTSGCDEDRDGTAAEPCVLTPTDFPDAATPVFLEARIDPSGANNLLIPRQRIASVGYAMNADTVDGIEAAALTSSTPPKSASVYSGVISIPASTIGYLGPFDLDGFDTVSVQMAFDSGPGTMQVTPEFRNDPNAPFVSATVLDCTTSSGNTTSCFPGAVSAQNMTPTLSYMHLLPVAARYLRLRYESFAAAGTYTFRVFLYLRRDG